MDEYLKELIVNFEKKLTEAQEARQEVMDYLEDNYDIDTRGKWEELEDGNDWCYGIDIDEVERLIDECEKEE
jgi:hypothetical protein